MQDIHKICGTFHHWSDCEAAESQPFLCFISISGSGHKCRTNKNDAKKLKPQSKGQHLLMIPDFTNFPKSSAVDVLCLVVFGIQI